MQKFRNTGSELHLTRPTTVAVTTHACWRDARDAFNAAKAERDPSKMPRAGITTTSATDCATRSGVGITFSVEKAPLGPDEVVWSAQLDAKCSGTKQSITYRASLCGPDRTYSQVCNMMLPCVCCAECGWLLLTSYSLVTR